MSLSPTLLEAIDLLEGTPPNWRTDFAVLYYSAKLSEDDKRSLMIASTQPGAVPSVNDQAVPCLLATVTGQPIAAQGLTAAPPGRVNVFINTQRWYEVLSVVAGVSITLDRTCSTAAGAAGVVNIGGALTFGAATDDAMMEAPIPGNTVWIKSGTYTLGGSVVISSGSGQGNILVTYQGYTTVRGDTTNGDDRPLITCAANTWTPGGYGVTRNLRFTSTSATGSVTSGTRGTWENCKSVNTAIAASGVARLAFTATTQSRLIRCEFVGQGGAAVQIVAADVKMMSCYIHDSLTGIYLANAVDPSSFQVQNCIIANCRNQAVSNDANTQGRAFQIVSGCTFYGFATPRGIGMNILNSTVSGLKIENCLIAGFVTGITGNTIAQASNESRYTTFYNNTTNTAVWPVSGSDVTGINPAFVDVAEITGTTATSAVSVLTQPGGDFSAVEDNVDYLHVLSGTAVTAGTFLITSHTATTLTVNGTIGTSGAGNINYIIATGHDYRLGPALKGLADGNIPGMTGTSNLDPGALQRAEGGETSSAVAPQ